MDHTGQVNCSLLPRLVDPVVIARRPGGTTGKSGRAWNASHTVFTTVEDLSLPGSKWSRARDRSEAALQRVSLGPTHRLELGLKRVDGAGHITSRKAKLRGPTLCT
jgi:hypothetical protein